MSNEVLDEGALQQSVLENLCSLQGYFFPCFARLSVGEGGRGERERVGSSRQLLVGLDLARAGVGVGWNGVPSPQRLSLVPHNTPVRVVVGRAQGEGVCSTLLHPPTAQPDQTQLADPCCTLPLPSPPQLTIPELRGGEQGRGGAVPPVSLEADGVPPPAGQCHYRQAQAESERLLGLGWGWAVDSFNSWCLV